ncbi:MAG: asparagine synthase (glutamine-hydrolyzing) [Flavobacteriaceae bacterium]|nr:asparagine synthase (glutamine-hydrolyzing) [Flavobacteriaceae bacterium]
MCGICGQFNFNESRIIKKDFVAVNDSLIHRGPDNGSIKVFENVALGHRRLSIIDLSDNANQPMSSHDERYFIVFNGEVYNFLDIKKDLEINGIKFYTKSDTEVILNAYMHYGDKCFSMFNGMFALAIYDNIKKELILVRDQFGIKPIYFYQDDNKLIFSSEKKAILKSKDVILNINKQALLEYMWYGNPLGNNTFYREINELEPGNIIKISKDKITNFKYFNINSIKEIDISEQEAINRIKYLFEESVKRHLISDVPVGVFLSGGIDSSAITAYASKHYKGKLKTFSICFDYDKGVNELSLASKVAKKFGTDHTEVKISGDDLINVLESLDMSHDEPFGDAANIPLYLISKKLKGKIKVVLQGDGGDEFFGGYSRYNTIKNKNKWKILSFLPKLIELIQTENTKILRFQRFIDAITQKNQYVRNALLLTMESKYRNPIKVFNESMKNELKKLNPFERYKDIYCKYPKILDYSQALFFTDSQIVLKDTFFEKVDKSTMANSMEIRIPFLDKELTEFALSLPAKLKTKKGVPKYLLKKAFKNLIPDEILYGSKKGFGVPYGYWLKTSLKEYFLTQLNTDHVKNFIDIKVVEKMFYEHLRDKGNHGFLLWKVLILSIWLNKNKRIFNV